MDLLDEIGSKYPIDLGTPARRAAARQAIHALLPGWGYQPLRKVGGPINHPTSGGASHQTEEVTGAMLAGLLFEDDLALETARVRGWNLLGRPGDMDNAHSQNWLPWSVYLAPTQAKRKALAVQALECYRIATLSRVLDARNPHRFGGIRPEVRSMGLAFEWAWWMDQFAADGLLTQAQRSSVETPEDYRQRAWMAWVAWFSARKTGFGDGTGRGFVQGPHDYRRWPFYTSDSDYSIGQHVVYFHWLLWMIELWRTEIFGGGILKPWLTATRTVATWALDIGFDPRGGRNCFCKSGRGSFRPSVFTGDSPVTEKDSRYVKGPFRRWPKAIREGTPEAKHRDARGENQYFAGPLLRYAKGSKAQKLAILRRVTVGLKDQTFSGCKDIWNPGTISPQLLWAAAEFAGIKE